MNAEYDAIRAFIAKKQALVLQYAETRPQKAEGILSSADKALKILAKMTSHRFCRRRPEDAESFLRVIRHAVAQEAPIPCTLGHGPLKNRNNCPAPGADWAEWFAFAQLAQLASAVRQIHEPGLAITLYLDDARAEYANGASPERTGAYRESLERLIADMGLGDLIPQVASLKALYGPYGHDAFIDEAQRHVRQWEADPANRDELETLREHARRNLPDDEGHGDEYPPSADCGHCVSDAVHRYLVYYEAEKLCGLWSRPDTLYMRYSPHRGFYQIFTLRRGSVSQPWQGQGAVTLLSSGKPDPCLLTRSRSGKSQVLFAWTPDVDCSPARSLPNMPLPVLAEAPLPVRTGSVEAAEPVPGG